MSKPRKRRSPHPSEQRPDARRSQRRVDARLLWALGAVALGVLVIAIAATEGNRPPASAGEPRDPVSVAAGAELYAASCASCHGADLRGTDTGPPFLDVIYAPNHHADEAFQRAVLGGVQPHHWGFGPMAPVPGLAREEVASIVEFVRSEQEAAGIFRDPSHG